MTSEVPSTRCWHRAIYDVPCNTSMAKLLAIIKSIGTTGLQLSIDLGKVPSMFMALWLFVRKCVALISLTPSFQVLGKKSLLIKIRSARLSSKLITVNKEMDVALILILTGYVSLRKRDSSSSRSSFEYKLKNNGPIDGVIEFLVFKSGLLYELLFSEINVTLPFWLRDVTGELLF